MHTTNFAACSSNPTQSTPSQEGKPSAEIQENTESRVGLESNFSSLDSDSQSKDSQKQNLESSFSESKNLTESTTPKNLNKALPNINNSACGSTMPKQNLWQ
ncbi:hypothetical protein [uncultured Helicobacter sp.]|uniref:hypothetical protein n=1 Tax=uncultured Helicobacter sp. TaxID=175537 RepID=UPI0037511C56